MSEAELEERSLHDEFLIDCALRFDYWAHLASFIDESNAHESMDRAVDAAMEGRLNSMSVMDKLCVFSSFSESSTNGVGIAWKEMRRSGVSFAVYFWSCTGSKFLKAFALPAHSKNGSVTAFRDLDLVFL